MPLSKDAAGGGANADGSKSADYCSKCYANGQFIQPNQTVEEMMELVRVRMKEMHFPGFLANVFVKGIPKLKRWQSPRHEA